MMNLENLLVDALRALGRVMGLDGLREQIIECKLLTARVLINQMRAAGKLGRISEAEFKVFSQFGDDGIIQYLIHRIQIPPDRQTFIEFGVQDYQESNTRFLLVNDNWRGLIFDAEQTNVDKIIQSHDYWRHDLTAVAAFIDRDNVNDLFVRHGFSGEIGLLSIDIDGNDYWVWERIEAVNPIIVVAEYNSTFGAQHAVTIPYDPTFQRGRAHYSNLYWGASLKALCLLAERKGYAFVGSNSAGNNAYFVRLDKLGCIEPISVEEGYVDARFRESRNARGELTYLRGRARLQEISGMELFDVERAEVIQIADLINKQRTNL
jgi:hypothetical protein